MPTITTAHRPLRRRTALWLLMTGVLGLLVGCAMPRPAKVPMDALWLPASSSGPGHTLVVFMPGSQEVPQDIVREGFVDQLRLRHPGVDMVVADAHMGYFRNGSFEARLRADVIEPARARGSTSATAPATGWSRSPACSMVCCRPITCSARPAATTGRPGRRCGSMRWSVRLCDPESHGTDPFRVALRLR